MDSEPPIRIGVWYPQRRALLASSTADGTLLTLFVATPYALAVGTPVVLEVSLGDSQLRFEVEGRVRARTTAGRTVKQEAGLVILFEGAHKKSAARMLATCAGRSANDGTALDSRFAVDVECRLSVKGASLVARVADVSSTGAFIKAVKLTSIRKDGEITIQIDPIFGRWGGHVLKARVVWIGEKNGIHGLGVRFLDERSHVRDSLKRHLVMPPRS